MPSPRAGESRDDFLDRCIPEVVAEGRDPDQAVAMCIAYYEGEKDKAFNVDKMGEVEYWKAFDRRRQSFQSKYERKIRKAFNDQLSIFRNAGTIADLRKDVSEQPIKDLFLELYTDVGDVFARRTWAGLKNMPYTETKQEPAWIERMRKYALIDASGRILEITKTTQNRINAIIVAGLEAGLSIDEIQTQIVGTAGLSPLNGTLTQRARRIARTEIISASNAGSLEGARSTGLNFKKQWLATPGPRTRDDHIIADGQIVGKDEMFLVGGEELEYPGDPAGSPGNVINCRCTQIYITEDS